MNAKAQAKKGKVSGVRPGSQVAGGKGRHGKNKLPEVRGVLGEQGLSERVEAAWATVPIGWPTCAVEPDRVCVWPLLHEGDCEWVSLKVAELPEASE
jgi:hypothetical protein